MIEYPKELDAIFNKLATNQLKPVIVGGYVRDSLLQIQSKDIDIEVYGVNSFETLEKILYEFGSVNSVGKSFGVCKLSYKGYDLDFSLPREDNKTASGHKGFKIITKVNISYKDAAIRRDFTINSMGYDLINKTLLDPFNGLKDLKNKTLNAVNEDTFVEDPLRILRGVQFSARFGFEMSEKLLLLCTNMVKNHMLDELSHERIYEEIKKLLLKSQTPSTGFTLLKKVGALKYFSELDALDNDAYKSTLRTLDAIKENKIILKLAALVHKLSTPDAIAFITNLTSDKTLLTEILKITQNYQMIEKIYENGIKDYDIYKLATKATIEDLVCLSEAICIAEDKNCISVAMIKDRAIELEVFKKKLAPILQGKDIVQFGIKPSEIFSKILNDAYDSQMNSKFNSHQEALSWLESHYSYLLS